MSERTILLLHTEAPTRRTLARERPAERLVLASDCVTAEDAAFYDEVVPLPPVEDVAGTLDRLTRIAADDVVVQTEHGLLAGALLVRRLGIAGPTLEAALLTTNKWLCREALRAASVPVPRYALVSSSDDVRRFADGRYPVVVKPVASTLGHLVTKIASAGDVDAAVARLVDGLPQSPHIRRCREFARLAGLDMGCDAERQFLVEDFVDGPPLETDGLVFGEDVDLFGVTEQVVSAPPYFFVEGYLFPVAAPRLEGISHAALRALRVSDAGFSIEFRGDVVIEVNGRLGEDAGFPDLFRAALGRSPIHLWLERDSAQPRVPRAHPANATGHAIAYANWYRDGVVRSAPEAPEGVEVLVDSGTRLHAPPHPDMAPHLAYALASHADGARAAYDEARARIAPLKFEIDEIPCAS